MRFIACTARRRVGSSGDEMVVIGATNSQEDAIARIQEYANFFYNKEPDGSLLLLCSVIELNEDGNQVNVWDVSLEPSTVYVAVVTERAPQ